MPEAISPELATLINQPPENDLWLHEIKWDGYRFICIVKNNKVKFYTRHQKDWTHLFPKNSNAIKKLLKNKNAILDGEMVVLDENQHADFQLLQNAIKQKNLYQPIYYVFDLLYYNQSDLRNWPLIERKKLLHKIITSINDPYIRYCDHIIGHGQEVFAKASALKLEGIVSKEISSPYVQKRTRSWLKTKCINRQEFIICGFTKPKGSRRHFGSLVLGIMHHATLQYCGLVGTGFTEESLHQLSEKLNKYIIQKSPFKNQPPLRDVTWVKPLLIAEIEFAEWTKDQVLRQARFKGIRSDKSVAEIHKENPKIIAKNNTETDFTNQLTHPNKLLFPTPKITKLKLAKFYQSIQEWIIPYIKQRPLTLVRCPNGQGHACFYQKHLEQSIKSIHPINIRDKEGKSEYSYINDMDGLIALVQMCVLEIHLWNCHVDQVNKPDLIIFDLDPAPDISWKKVIQCAYHIKEQLEKINLKSFVKTTGGKGLHIVIPIARHYSWKQIYAFSAAFVKTLALEKPDEYVATMSKEKRRGKIFIDYFRNNFGATSVAPYSTRLSKNATVSVPLFWDELSARIQSDHFTVKNVEKRLAQLSQDPWDGFFELKQTLLES